MNHDSQRDDLQLWQGIERLCNLIETRVVKSNESFVPLDTFFTTTDESTKYANKLIISSGDISDVDGFFALAKYAQQPDTDVIFVMNFPAILGNQKTPTGPELNEAGLGYTYDTTTYLNACTESLKSLSTLKYNELLKAYSTRPDKEAFRAALSDMAFNICHKVFYEQKNQKKNGGNLFFCIGGINSINPFSKEVLKNELFEYAELDIDKKKLLTTTEGDIIDTSGRSMSKFVFASYNNIKIDFNGSMAWFSPEWEKILHEVRDKIRGAYVMGGVYSDCSPQTMPAMPGILNRFSCSTMNQLYSPIGTVKFMEFLKSHTIKTFIISNNESCSVKKEYKVFLKNNGIEGDFIQKISTAYYESHYKPPRKPFDLYAALALVAETPNSEKRKVFYDSIFGTFVIGDPANTWESTLSQIQKNISTIVNPAESEFLQNKARSFQTELATLATFDNIRSTSLYSMNCYNVRFSSDATHKIQIVPKK